jgi:membrane-associated phospholipid phosphatase
MSEVRHDSHELPPEAAVAVRGTAGVLAAGGVSLAGALILLAAEGRWDPLQDLDVSVATNLHEAVRDHPAVVRALDVIALVGEPTVFRVLVVVTVIVLWARGWRRLAAWCAAVMAVGGLVGVGMKYAVARARPVLPDPVAAASGYSFPSSHALNSALCCGALLVALAATNRRVKPAALAAAVVVALVGFDRIALGVHFTSDVIAGWFTAGAVVLGALAGVHLDRLRFRRRSRSGTPAG